MACCVTGSHAEDVQTPAPKLVVERAHAACGRESFESQYAGTSARALDSNVQGDCDEDALRRSSSTTHKMDKNQLDDDLLDACVEKLIDTKRSGECEFYPENIPIPFTSMKSTEAMHRIPCPPYVSQQLKESFATFRSDVSYDFQDWKRDLCSELRQLIQGVQMPDVPRSPLNPKVSETGARGTSPPSHTTSTETSRSPRNPKVSETRAWGASLPFHTISTESCAQRWTVATHPWESKDVEACWTGTEVAAHNVWSEKVEPRQTIGTVKALPSEGTVRTESKITVGSYPTLMFQPRRRTQPSSHKPFNINRFNPVKAAVRRLSRYNTIGSARGVRLFGNIGDVHSDSFEDDETSHAKRLYHTSGAAQYVANSTWFHITTLVMICCSAIYMGFETDCNDHQKLVEWDWKFQVPEHALTIFFTFEIWIRFAAFARKRDTLSDYWFVVDFLLAVHMLVDNYLMSFLLSKDAGSRTMRFVQLVRLLRLAKFTRLLRASPEMATMIRAMYAGTKAVASAIMMLLVLTYSFALALHTLLASEVGLEAYFGDVLRSMWTLLLQGLFMDGIGVLFVALRQQPAPFAICFLLLYVLLSTFVVMNMLLGIFCEVVSKVAAAEEESDAGCRVRESLKSVLHRLGSASPGFLKKDEFLKLFRDPEALMTFFEHGIDASYVMDMSDMLFTEAESEVPMSMVIGLFLKHRAHRTCQMGDMISAMQCQRFWTDRAQQKSTAQLKHVFERHAQRGVVSRGSHMSGSAEPRVTHYSPSIPLTPLHQQPATSIPNADIDELSCVIET